MSVVLHKLSEQEIKQELFADITWEEVNEKVEQNLEMDSVTKKKLKDLMWKYKEVFRRQPGLLISFEHVLTIKEGQPFVGRS